MKKYINYKNGNLIETVDEFEYNNKLERIEAKRCLNEYRLAYNTGYLYLSSRACKDWSK